MKTLRYRSPCQRVLLAIAVMSLAMFAALAAGSEAAARQAVEKERRACGPSFETALTHLLRMREEYETIDLMLRSER